MRFSIIHFQNALFERHQVRSELLDFPFVSGLRGSGGVQEFAQILIRSWLKEGASRTDRSLYSCFKQSSQQVEKDSFGRFHFPRLDSLSLSTSCRTNERRRGMNLHRSAVSSKSINVCVEGDSSLLISHKTSETCAVTPLRFGWNSVFIICQRI